MGNQAQYKCNKTMGYKEMNKNTLWPYSDNKKQRSKAICKKAQGVIDILEMMSKVEPKRAITGREKRTADTSTQTDDWRMQNLPGKRGKETNDPRKKATKDATKVHQ